MVQEAKDVRVANSGATPPQKESTQEWRALLIDHALLRWQGAVDCLSNGERIPARDDAAIVPLISSLGPQGEEAIRIVDRFALGAATEAFVSGNVEEGPDQEFEAQLETILDGFGQVSEETVRQRMVEADREGSRRRPTFFDSRLWQVLHKVRESAEMSYNREIRMVELDRRIIFLLRKLGAQVPAAISAAVGVDKAQVSRSVKRLLELGMVERDQIRSPIALTEAGEKLTDRLLRRAELRNRELGFDISDGELQDFFSVMELLLDRAVSLYDHERELASEGGNDGDGHTPAYDFEERRSGEPIVIDRSRIASPLFTLVAYLSRSGALKNKRTIGLSNFEAWVLAEISYDPPTDWPRLVRALERDHSQAGRTVNHLIERGLVTREGQPGRRHGRFSPTEEGLRLYRALLKSGEKRAAFLMDAVPPEKRESFQAVFEKLHRNAAAQLERERALEELADV